MLAQIDDTVYRIHRYFLRDSSIFSDMFSLPCSDEGQAEGTTDDNPIELKGQDKAEFDCFLSFFYPLCVPSCHLSSIILTRVAQVRL
jgi:hypothetical protein